MAVHLVDPLSDPRWEALVERHPRASVFHSKAWLEALHRTHGWSPFALTTTPAGRPLEDGWPCARVTTWLSRRVVSLPFTDHCEPLVGGEAAQTQMLAHLRDEVSTGRAGYVEIRPRSAAIAEVGSFVASSTYYVHTLDLAPSLDRLFTTMHPSCVRRAVRRAERERLEVVEGRAESELSAFYRLLQMTRRRHGLPPPPRSWFRNLAECMGDRLTVHLATRDGSAMAGVLTLRFRDTLVYKYGASDARHHHLGGMPFLFWKVIQEAKAAGVGTLDLGRSDLDQPGLIAFKEHLGATRSTIRYHQCGGRPRSARAGYGIRAARWVFERTPMPLLTVAGRLLYRYFG